MTTDPERELVSSILARKGWLLMETKIFLGKLLLSSKDRALFYIDVD